MRLARLARLGLLVCGLMGCGPDNPCPGDHTPIVGECTQGLMWADCRGDGPPRFACGEAGGCVWFSTSCVPQGYRATDCPTSDPCCHRDAEGSWPFPDHWRPDARANVANMVEDVVAFGGRPVTRSRPWDIQVQLDASYEAEEPGVRCDPGVDRELCTLGAPTLLPLWNGLALWSSSNEPGAEHFWIELANFGQVGTPIGRAYLRVSPADDLDGAPSCELAGTRPSSTPITGTIVVNRFDVEPLESLHGRAELVIDGGQVTFTF